MLTLVFVAGLFFLAAVEDMLREAYETVEDFRLSSLSFIGGFSLFIGVAGTFG